MMTNLLAALFGANPTVVQLLTALLGLITASATLTATVLGILNRRRTKRTEATADSTHGLVRDLVAEIRAQRQEHDGLWTAYLQKDTIANPEGVRRIATETAAELTERELLPMRQFLAATEIVESRRTHSPDTDVIRVLQEITA